MANAEIRISVHSTPDSLPVNPWRQRTEWLEYDLAVKWFAVEARCEGELAGFMHVIRHPARAGEWYACDVFTAERYRRQGVAAAMYGEALKHLSAYFRANRITASVSRGNEASVRLHEKLGFRDTREPPAFPDFLSAPDETLYEHWFAREIPARDVPIHRGILTNLATKNRGSVLTDLEQSGTDPGKTVLLIWAGQEAIGYRLAREEEPVLRAEWQERRERGCLAIRG